MIDRSESPRPTPKTWLLLIHQLPPEPAYLRVKLRRRLRRLGAVPLKKSVFVLPDTEPNLEDFQWLAKEIVGDGGEAIICSATFLSGASDIHARLGIEEPGSATETIAIDARPHGALWVTRRDVFVDRMASAWLIRRFIDKAARFRFVAARGYRKRPKELRFDMFRGEFTHEGDRCTFETLLARFGLSDPALQAIGQIVHDIDLKDDKFGRPEASGVASVLRGITHATDDDQERIDRAALVFDGLHAQLQRSPGAKKSVHTPPASRSRVSKR